ncbi:hypothetical protein [Klebsiella pasteurii]|nr:hypothetical protein [Klebsiella pasteurii]MDV1911784.1 hypothetical protein [Klebsiella pasteurii]
MITNIALFAPHLSRFASVWGALIFGVVVLALMAWRIWREVKKSGSV